MQRISKLGAVVFLTLACLLVISLPVMGNEIEGALISIAPDDFTFTMTDKEGAEQIFRLRVDGQVMINDEARNLADLQAGDRVTVSYEIEDKDMVATIIQCKRD